MNKTRATKQSEVTEKWYHLDATGHRVGHIASVAAELLLAKNDPKMRPNLMPKTKVVITNAEKIDATPRRLMLKTYTSYSGFPGGLKVRTMEEMMEKQPLQVLERAVKGMLPKGKRGNAIYVDNLYIYTGDEHKHEAQKPETVDIKKFRV